MASLITHPHWTVSGWHPIKRTQFLARLLSRLRRPGLSTDGYLALIKGAMDATETTSVGEEREFAQLMLQADVER